MLYKRIYLIYLYSYIYIYTVQCIYIYLINMPITYMCTFACIRFHSEISYQLVALKETYHKFPSMTSKLNQEYRLLASTISCDDLVRRFVIGEQG